VWTLIPGSRLDADHPERGPYSMPISQVSTAAKSYVTEANDGEAACPTLIFADSIARQETGD
jgi:hypothetical protein